MKYIAFCIVIAFTTLTAKAQEPFPPPIVSPNGVYPPVQLAEVAKHMGEQVNVRGIIADYRELDHMLLVDLGAPYPNNLFTIVFRGDARVFCDNLKNTTGTNVIVLGTIVDFKGKPAIEITKADKIFLQP